MDGLTREDWIEIYYALVDKQARIEEGELGEYELENSGQGDASTWIAHLGDIIETIGPDGENMYPEKKGICPKCGQHFFTHNGDGSCVED